MRDELLHLPDDPSKLTAFLNRWGFWLSGSYFDFSSLNNSCPFAVVFPHELYEAREMYRRALIGTAKDWLGAGNHLTLSSSDKPPYFSVKVSECNSAIRATITIDHLMNTTFGVCKRADCRKLFEFVTQQRRMYCTQYCAHIENVRKQRAKLKKSNKGKGRAKDASRKSS